MKVSYTKNTVCFVPESDYDIYLMGQTSLFLKKFETHIIDNKVDFMEISSDELVRLIFKEKERICK